MSQPTRTGQLPQEAARQSGEWAVENTQEILIGQALDLAQFLADAKADPARTVISLHGNVVISAFLVAAREYQDALDAH